MRNFTRFQAFDKRSGPQTSHLRMMSGWLKMYHSYSFSWRPYRLTLCRRTMYCVVSASFSQPLLPTASVAQVPLDVSLLTMSSVGVHFNLDAAPGVPVAPRALALDAL